MEGKALLTVAERRNAEKRRKRRHANNTRCDLIKKKTQDVINTLNQHCLRAGTHNSGSHQVNLQTVPVNEPATHPTPPAPCQSASVVVHVCMWPSSWPSS